MAFGLKGYPEHLGAAAELHTHMQPVLPPACWPAGEINLPKTYLGKQVLGLGGLWPRGTGCWVRAWPAWCRLGLCVQGASPPGKRQSAPAAGPHRGAAEAWAQLGEAKVQPNAGSAPQLHFPPAGPAASLAAWLGAIYTSLHGHFTAQKGLVEKLRK